MLPNLPQDGKKIIGYRDAMTLPKQPKSLVVVGSGAIGVEKVGYWCNVFVRHIFAHGRFYQAICQDDLSDPC
jgi:pyruvate/2-oxoglutarate dehydrogenase complex dihydrolipoamide dehydrogenase (E3) component